MFFSNSGGNSALVRTSNYNNSNVSKQLDFENVLINGTWVNPHPLNVAHCIRECVYLFAVGDVLVIILNIMLRTAACGFYLFDQTVPKAKFEGEIGLIMWSGFSVILLIFYFLFGLASYKSAKYQNIVVQLFGAPPVYNYRSHIMIEYTVWGLVAGFDLASIIMSFMFVSLAAGFTHMGLLMLFWGFTLWRTNDTEHKIHQKIRQHICMSNVVYGDNGHHAKQEKKLHKSIEKSGQQKERQKLRKRLIEKGYDIEEIDVELGLNSENFSDNDSDRNSDDDSDKSSDVSSIDSSSDLDSDEEVSSVDSSDTD